MARTALSPVRLLPLLVVPGQRPAGPPRQASHAATSRDGCVSGKSGRDRPHLRTARIRLVHTADSSGNSAAAARDRPHPGRRWRARWSRPRLRPCRHGRRRRLRTVTPAGGIGGAPARNAHRASSARSARQYDIGDFHTGPKPRALALMVQVYQFLTSPTRSLRFYSCWGEDATQVHREHLADRCQRGFVGTRQQALPVPATSCAIWASIAGCPEPAVTKNCSERGPQLPRLHDGTSCGIRAASCRKGELEHAFGSVNRHLLGDIASRHVGQLIDDLAG